MAEGSGDEFGGSVEDNAEGGSRQDGTILPASQADLKTSERRKGQGGDSWQYGQAIEQPDPRGSSGEDLAAIPAARFFPFEGTKGYLWLLRQIVTRYGNPVSIYQDRHGSLKPNDDHWTLEEELAGRQEPTQVGQALRALGIQPCFALSPQAKGRIERLFGTLQDRLIAKNLSTAPREPIRALPRNPSPAPEVKSFNWVHQASAQPIYGKPFG